MESQLSLCIKNIAYNLHQVQGRGPDLKKTPQTPLPCKFQINLFGNFIHCTKQTWNLLDTDVTELEKQMDF